MYFNILILEIQIIDKFKHSNNLSSRISLTSRTESIRDWIKTSKQKQLKQKKDYMEQQESIKMKSNKNELMQILLNPFSIRTDVSLFLNQFDISSKTVFYFQYFPIHDFYGSVHLSSYIHILLLLHQSLIIHSHFLIHQQSFIPLNHITNSLE